MLEQDGRELRCEPFKRKELLGPLERWFFGVGGLAPRLLRATEVGVRDRVAVRIVGREAERPVDALLELLRERVLEPVGLVVHLVHLQAERLREVELEQPVMADHLDATRSPAAVSATPR